MGPKGIGQPNAKGECGKAFASRNGLTFVNTMLGGGLTFRDSGNRWEYQIDCILIDRGRFLEEVVECGTGDLNTVSGISDHAPVFVQLRITRNQQDQASRKRSR